MKTPEEREFDLALDLMLDGLADELVGKGGSFVGPVKPPHGKLGPSAGLRQGARAGVNAPALGQKNPLHMTGPPGHTEWVEEEHPRGKTTDESTPGSFAPKGGGEREKTPFGQRNLPIKGGLGRGRREDKGRGRFLNVQFKPEFPIEKPATMGLNKPLNKTEETYRTVTASGITDIEPLGGGVGRTFTAMIDGVKVALKTDDTPSYRENIPQGNETGREVAAYIVNRALDFLVDLPVAVQRTFDEIEGPEVGNYDAGPLGRVAIIEWRSGRKWGHVGNGRPTDVLKPAEFRAAALFDAIIGNEDRHGGNGNIDAEGHFISIDHSLAFPAGHVHGNLDFIESHPQSLLSQEVARLKTFYDRREEVTSALSKYLRDVEIEGMWYRVSQMIQTKRLSLAGKEAT